MLSQKYRLTKLSCYSSNFSMTSVFCLPPMLFVTFREMYGISYTLLGTLVLVNFCTQLMIDLVFTFFSKYFNIKLTVSVMPIFTSLGLIIYALAPVIFKDNVYLGLLIGTVLFSVSAGLSEVLLSPIVAAIPSEHVDRDMSLLHSLYAWGLVAMVALCSVFIFLFGSHNWPYLVMIMALLPIVSAILFMVSPLPPMEFSSTAKTAKGKKYALGIALCVACIFLGGAAEVTMTNWLSTFAENTLNLPKLWVDIGGLAIFAALLGFGRTLYSKYGKNISAVLLWGMISSFICYLIVGLTSSNVVAIVACVFMGFCVSMLWPGTLIFMEENMPSLGVAAYALMAAGGDLGASVAPQLMGIVVDSVSQSNTASSLAQTFSVTSTDIGMKAGMLVSSLFPLCGIVVVILLRGYFKKRKKLS